MPNLNAVCLTVVLLVLLLQQYVSFIYNNSYPNRLRVSHNEFCSILCKEETTSLRKRPTVELLPQLFHLSWRWGVFQLSEQTHENCLCPSILSRFG